MLNMNRRDLLTHIVVGSVVGIPGCLGDAETPDDGNESDGDVDSTNPEIDDQPCSPYEADRDSAVCSHTVDPDAASVYIEPTPESSTLDDGTPVDDITLTFYNQSSSELTVNPHSWSIWYTPETEWEELHQELSGDGHLTVSPGNTHSWSFVEAVEAIQEEPDLEPGLYAAELGVPDPENSDDRIACIAFVQLDSAQ